MTLNINAKKKIEELKKRKKTTKELSNKATGLSVLKKKETPPTLSDVINAVNLLGEKRKYVIKSIIATFISTFMGSNDPIWLMIVGAPGSNKTTLVELLSPMKDHVLALDTLTANPFVSGKNKKEKPQDLLKILKGKCFIIKEYAPILSRSDEMVKQLLGELTAIYDGVFTKFSSDAGLKSYQTRFSHIGCVTPAALHSRSRYMNAIGPRFLYLRLIALTEEEKNNCLDQIWKNSDKLDKDVISSIIIQYCEILIKRLKSGIDISFPEDVQLKITTYAKILAKSRSEKITSRIAGTSYETISIQTEEPFRALKQLRKFAKALAIVNQNTEVGEDELKIVKRVVFSSMPVRIYNLLDLYRTKDSLEPEEASKLLNRNKKTIKNGLEDLVNFGILDKHEKFALYSLRDEFKDLFLDN